MTRKKEKTLYWASLVLVILLAIMAGFTIAWVAVNRQVDSDGVQMQLNGESMTISDYDVYRYNQNSDSFENITSTDADYHLTPYDTIFTERNVNTPLLFAVTVYGFATDTESLDVSFYTDLSLSASPEGEYTSNLVYMKAATSSQINSWLTESHYTAASSQIDSSLTESHYTSAADCRNLYEKAISYFAGNGTAQTFVTASYDSTKKTYVYNNGRTNPVTCTVSLNETEQENQQAVIYFIIDYDPTLIEAQNLGTFSVMNLQKYTSGIQFDNDISLITFSSGN